MASNVAAAPSSKRKGPPAPLNLSSRSLSVPSLAVVAGSLQNDLAAPAERTTMTPRGAATTRNVKRLSLSISSTDPNPFGDPLPSPAIQQSAQPALPPKRRPVASLPAGTSAAAVLRRNDEGDASAAEYLDGPIEIMPGIWLGSEDNARDWRGLIKRGIKSILNVAKEVASPFDSPSYATNSSEPHLPLSSAQPGTYQPPHLPSGRPAMHYLKLAWSHGQANLVRGGFPEAMQFVDEALARKEGVLVHCQCGISRSATMVIALVMRAARDGGSGVSPEVLALRSKGMQGAYDFVQKKSRSIGPNMSLIYQLLDYERALKGADSPGAASVTQSEDEEWERRRRELDSPEEDIRESQEVMKEAKALDREMEERRARRLSQTSNNSSTASFTGAVGNGAPWRMRYGSGVRTRSRAASMESNFTTVSSVSILSEDPLEEEDEDDERDPTKVTTPDTDATDDDAHCFGMQRDAAFAQPVKRAAGVPPSAPPSKTSFGLPPPSASAYRQSFGQPSNFYNSEHGIVGPSAQTLSVKKGKHRPPPLKAFAPAVPFPSVQVVADQRDRRSTSRASMASTSSSASGSSHSRRISSRLSSLVPFPVQTPTTSTAQPVIVTPSMETPSASQTLFVFPPSPRARGTSTPSTLTLVCTPLLTPSFGASGSQTPRPGLIRRRTDSKKSWIGLSAVTPTTATARVDARGLFESS